MKDYIEAKIKELQEISNPQGYLTSLANTDSETRRLWKAELERKDSFWRSINTNEDVLDLIERFNGQVSFVEKHVPYGSGHIEDGYNMALSEYRAMQGLRKLAQFIDPSPFHKTQFTPMSESEIDEIFNRMHSIIKRKNQQDLRRAMQD